MRTRRRKLFVDARWLAQPGQGTCTYFHEIYSRLVQRQVPELELMFGLVSGHKPNFIMPGTRTIEYRSDGLLWRLFSLGREINRLQPDFVHFQYLLPFGLAPSVHKIVALHDVIFLEHPEFFKTSYRLSRKLLFGMSARMADTLLTISELSAHEIHKHMGIPRQQINVIPLGAGSRLKNITPVPLPCLAGQRYLLTVGRHEPRKNYPRLIEAYRRSGLWPNQGIKLVIAGWLARGFDGRSVAAGDGVELLTDCDDAQLAWLYQNAKGFIFPSVAEGYGLPLVEALEFNLACATSLTHPIDVLRDACVASFDPYSIDEIISSLCMLAGDTSVLLRPSAPIPTWDDHVDRFLDIIINTPLK
jgi:glycosyltransferase involved in cell wall biosynthesis